MAEKGKEAIEKLSLNQYDVALVDLVLPDMEGAELFTLIKNASPKTLRIMLTGKSWLEKSINGQTFLLENQLIPNSS